MTKELREMELLPVLDVIAELQEDRWSKRDEVIECSVSDLFLYQNEYTFTLKADPKPAQINKCLSIDFSGLQVRSLWLPVDMLGGRREGVLIRTILEQSL